MKVREDVHLSWCVPLQHLSFICKVRELESTIYQKSLYEVVFLKNVFVLMTDGSSFEMEDGTILSRQ